jgi:translation initiation factor 3 subunit D
MVFRIPLPAENDDGWGPAGGAGTSDFADVPYAPFNKSDRLGCAADWTQTGYGKFGGSAYPASRWAGEP